MKKALLLILSLLILSPSLFADQKAMKARMIRELDVIKGLFETQYAPAEWKKSFAGWELEKAIDESKEKVRNFEKITIKDYHRILSDFFNSMKDYHVDVRFYATEKALLPFQIKGAEGRYFFVYVDRKLLPKGTFPFEVGDELVKFGEVATDVAVKEFKKSLGDNVAQTDQALAEILLTRRFAKAARPMMKGPIMLTVKKKESGKIVTRQLIWDYTPEKINNEVDFSHSSRRLKIRSNPRHSFLDKEMITPLWSEFVTAADDENPHFLGTRESFIPPLGEKLWETQKENPFLAYIYQTPEGRRVGYVRIPHYDTSDGSGYFNATLFANVIERFEGETEALVIDQVNNPGGSVFYLYALASMLSDQALMTPRHRMTITQGDVFDAYESLSELEKVTSDEQARSILGDSLSGYPVSYQLARYFVDYCHFTIDEWNAGRTLTRPYYLTGIDAINPASVHYTKPILLLVNQLDFSGGDFFPAILQDNKRVTILGTRTAGAGGYVRETKYPNQFGIEFFTVTGSIAVREAGAGLPIENLGVTPDIEYDLTADDLANNYEGYLKAIHSAVAGLLN